MKVPLQKGSERFVELNFKPGSWEHQGVPEKGCRLTTRAFERMIANGGQVEVDELILGLMAWLDVTDDPQPAMQTLRTLLDLHHPPDGRSDGRVRFQDEDGIERIFHVGPVDCSGPVVAWQRRHWVIAVAQRSEETGRITVGAPGALSLDVAKRILDLSILKNHGPFDSFEGAVRSSGSTGSFYSWEGGSATTCSWEHGLGIQLRDGEMQADPAACQTPAPETEWLAPNQVARMIAIAAGY